MPDSFLSIPAGAGRSAWRPAAPRAVLQTAPSPEAPLSGLTLLAVEDSRFASDVLRLMAQRAGARLRRAETVAAAMRHLAVYRPDLVIVDPGLPDGDGLALVAAIVRRPAAPPVLVTSGRPELAEAARAAGAARFMAKPVPGLAAFRSAVLSCLPDRAWLAGQDDGDDPALPAADPLALQDDLRQAARRLAMDPDDREGRYLAGFVAGLARATNDPGLAAAAARPGPAGMRDLAGIIADRLRRARPERMIAP